MSVLIRPASNSTKRLQGILLSDKELKGVLRALDAGCGYRVSIQKGGPGDIDVESSEPRLNTVITDADRAKALFSMVCNGDLIIHPLCREADYDGELVLAFAGQSCFTLPFDDEG